MTNRKDESAIVEDIPNIIKTNHSSSRLDKVRSKAAVLFEMVRFHSTTCDCHHCEVFQVMEANLQFWWTSINDGATQ